MENHSLRFILVLSLITAPLAGAAFIFGFQASSHFSNHAPSSDGYVPPRDIGAIVDATQASTVGVSCKVAGEKKKGGLGSGWAIDLAEDRKDLRAGFSSLIVTNYHVIDDCLDESEGKVEVQKYEGKWRSAYIIRLDKKNDLALIATEVMVPTLQLSDWAPYPGYWTMAVGNADGFEGSVAIGTTLNLLMTEVLITNNVSSGNSGGPLVDNEGRVIGTVTWTSTREQYNGAKSLDAMCAVIIACKDGYFWEWD
jgi:S1-C subfamily serine protease